MGTGASKQPPEVHVVVVQSKEDGRIDAKVVRRSEQHQELDTSNSSEDPRYQYSRQPKPRNQSHNIQINSTCQYGEHHETNFKHKSPDPLSEQSRTDVSSTPEFKIFRTYNNEEYTVYVREDGKMFYVDWEDQKWRVFPSEWCKHGSFENEGSQHKTEREGELIHPFRGKLTTLLRQESLNILYFFDEKCKGWLPMPLTWERQTPFVSKLVAEIKTTCPDWTDDKSIVATLRQCNYSTDDAMSFYLAINDEGVFDKVGDTSSGHAVLIEKLQQQIKDLEKQLSDCKDEKRGLESKIESISDELKDFKTENARLNQEIEKMKAEQHQQSISLRQSFGHGPIRLPPITLKLNIMRPLTQAAGREAKALKSKIQSTRHLLVKSIKIHNEQMSKLTKAIELLLHQYRSQANELDEVRTLYRKEALKRKLLFNEIQELRGNIRVFCRCRNDDSDTCALTFTEDDQIQCVSSQGRTKTFEFEKVYKPDTSQEQVFEDTCPIITSCADGYNICIIAYGQTGAGKTYTMMGPKNNPGVNIRSIQELFAIMKEKQQTDFWMKVSMVEVYNESVYDLLTSPSEIREKLQIQKNGKDIIVPGLTEIEVRSIDDVIKIMTVGEKNRTTASTKMNTNSSRSHLLLLLSLKSHNLVSGVTTRGRLTLVDLAGSERISRSEATGLRLVEAAAINKSLSALGQVFASIRDSALHIPFRNSKLTHLLQPCLGGDAKACMFVNVSPLQSNIPETLSSLEFGVNARQVALGKATSHVTRS